MMLVSSETILADVPSAEPIRLYSSGPVARAEELHARLLHRAKIPGADITSVLDDVGMAINAALRTS